MRTTITLEVDVAARLREFSRRTGKSFKQAVNDAVREGLSSPGVVRAEPLPSLPPSTATSRASRDCACNCSTDRGAVLGYEPGEQPMHCREIVALALAVPDA